MFESGVTVGRRDYTFQVCVEDQRVIMSPTGGSAKKNGEARRGRGGINPAVNRDLVTRNDQAGRSTRACGLTAIEAKGLSYLPSSERRAAEVQIIVTDNVIAVSFRRPPTDHVRRRRCAGRRGGTWACKSN